MFLTKLKINGIRWLVEAVVVLGALVYALYCRGEWEETLNDFDNYIEEQEAIVLKQINSNTIANVKKQAAMDKLQAKHANTMRYINELVKTNAETDNALAIERTNVSVLQSAIKASFSAQNSANSATSDRACADTVPGRIFRRIVLDCTQTTIMLEKLNLWKHQTCKQTPNLRCAKPSPAPQ